MISPCSLQFQDDLGASDGNALGNSVVVDVEDIRPPRSDDPGDAGEGTGDIPEVDRDPDNSPRFGKAFCDDAIDEVDIDVSPADHQNAIGSPYLRISL